MKQSFILLLAILILSTVTLLISDEVETSKLDGLLESLIEESNIDKDLEWQEIEHLIESPINLRYSTISDVFQLPTFTYSQSVKILQMVQIHGIKNYKTIADSAGISQNQTILLELCSVISEKYRSNILSIRSRYKYKLAETKGFRENKFLGSKLDLYNRIKFRTEHLSGGLLTNKNSGEKYLADFVSAYINLNHMGFNLILGDYYVKSGQGSILWSGFGMNKGFDVIDPATKIGSGIKPYLSSSESGFFRGLALQKKVNIDKNHQIRVSIWIANTPKSGNINDSTGVASSIYNQNYFRTESEVKKKSALTERSLGSNIEYQNGDLIIGASSLYLNYSNHIQSQSQSAFYGKSGLLASLYSHYSGSNFSLMSEVNKEASGKFSFRTGASYESGKYDFSVNARYFPNNFRSPYGQNFGEFSNPSNESGLYFGLRGKINRKFETSLYIDFYRSQERTYTVSDVVKGVDIFSEFYYYLLKNLVFKLRLKFEDKTTDILDTRSDSYLVYQKDNYSTRLQVDYMMNKKIRFRLRTELLCVEHKNHLPSEHGFLSYIDLRLKALSNLTFQARATYFDTDSYSSAIWQFEYPMQGQFRTEALYLSGYRYYGIVKYSVQKYIYFNLLFSETYKPQEESLGSGYNQIFTNRDSRMILQLSIKY